MLNSRNSVYSKETRNFRDKGCRKNGAQKRGKISICRKKNMLNMKLASSLSDYAMLERHHQTASKSHHSMATTTMMPAMASSSSSLSSSMSVVKGVIEPFTNKPGHKIQARSLAIYNAIVPTRDQVRKDNYDRRNGQMASMGFRTPINVPYRILGEPIHLETRQFNLYDPRIHSSTVRVDRDFPLIQHQIFTFLK